MTKARWIQSIAIVFVLGLFLIFIINLKSQAEVAYVGDEAIDFELEALNGDVHRLSDYTGKPIVLYFFTTWCSSCKSQTPEMLDFREEFGDDVEVLTIVRSESKRAVEKYMDESGHTDHLYLFDFNTEVSDSYGVVGQPETIIIDEDGIVADHIVGPLTKDLLVDKMGSMLP